MKPPPQCLNTERVVLASIIINGNIFAEIFDRFKEFLFYKPAHMSIANAIVRIYASGQPIDIVTLSDELRGSKELGKVGGCSYLSELTEDVSTTPNIGAYVKILESKHQLRESILLANKITNKAFDDDASGEVIIRYAEGVYNKLSYDSVETHAEYNHQESVYKYLQEIEDAKKNGKMIRGETSNMPDLDKIISGWEQGKVYLISGLEKLGKSRFVRSLASHWLNNNFGVAMFMLEEDEASIHECILANRCVVNTESMATAGMQKSDIAKVFDEANRYYMKQPLHISVKSGIDPVYVKSIIQRQKSNMAKSGKILKFAIVDYIQRMSGPGEGHEKFEYIASALANIARDENICIIEISQMGAGAEKNKNVALHTQLRYGKVFKEAAHCVITFDDPQRMGRNTDDNNFSIEDGSKTLLAHIIQRKGVSDITIKIIAQLQYARFNNAI